MALSLFNSFKKIFETKESPHARTLRTSLWQKFKDTYNTFHGEFVFHDDKYEAEQTYFGLYDYVTFFIPWGLEYIFPSSTLIFKPLRAFVSGFLTALFSPVVIGVYWISSALNSLFGWKNDMNQLKLTPLSMGNTRLELGAYIKLVGGIENLRVKVEEIEEECEEEITDSENWVAHTDRALRGYRLKFFRREMITDLTHEYSLEYSTEEDASHIKKGVRALMIENVGNIINNIHDDAKLAPNQRNIINALKYGNSRG